MLSSHSPSTSETTIDKKVGPITTHSDIETAAALPGVLEVERLTKSVMYIFASIFQKEKIWLTLSFYLPLALDVKSTGGCYHFLEFYLLFHLLTGQILA